ncbi:MAG: YHS domain-containing protein [Caldiserica bacterium]|jgi:YHS domain-containing protein|nr:YHS domain-containing protein [Caldisericota bacterium]
MAIDPVCGMEVDEQKAQFKTEYKGKSYYFCSRSCLSTFTQDPDKFLLKKADEQKER